MRLKEFFILSILSLSFSSCNLLLPDDIINPNVGEDTFLEMPNAMTAWVNGANRSFSNIIGSYAELIEIMSDNYYNNYSQSSKVFDFPTILYTDVDVTNLQRYIGMLRESADYGINTVAKADLNTTNYQLFNLYYIKGYSYLLAGEYFLGLPIQNGGEIKSWKENLNTAISVFAEALSFVDNSNDMAFMNTLISRAYYRMGDKGNAVDYANKALMLSNDFVKQVEFDGINGVRSSIQGYIFGTNFQPLPRLDFLDPKYFQLIANEQRPISIAKAEELYLILAEADLADGQVANAKSHLMKLLTLVNNRPVQYAVNDQLEGRYNGGYKEYPNSSQYRVAASPTEELSDGLVLDRQAPFLISIPYISGTSINEDMIQELSTVDEALEVVYLMRQEIFIAEGRRVADLGIRMPVCETEVANIAEIGDYIYAQIPSFIPLNQEMDAFVINKEEKTVVITHNMNKIIVKNKNSEYVAPFFK